MGAGTDARCRCFVIDNDSHLRHEIEKQNDGGSSDDDEQLAEKVRRSLHRLPKNLQDMYNANAPKKSFRDRVAAVSALARAAAEKANERASSNTTKAAQ